MAHPDLNRMLNAHVWRACMEHSQLHHDSARTTLRAHADGQFMTYLCLTDDTVLEDTAIRFLEQAYEQIAIPAAIASITKTSHSKSNGTKNTNPYDAIVLHRDSTTVKNANGYPILNLSRNRFELLYAIWRRKGTPVAINTINDDVWGGAASKNTIKVTKKHVNDELIQTALQIILDERKLGYILVFRAFKT